jgi:hypothetical protein
MTRKLRCQAVAIARQYSCDSDVANDVAHPRAHAKRIVRAGRLFVLLGWLWVVSIMVCDLQ